MVRSVADERLMVNANGRVEWTARNPFVARPSPFLTIFLHL
jgi:hypothetical protein